MRCVKIKKEIGMTTKNTYFVQEIVNQKWPVSWKVLPAAIKKIMP
jgi:hypothetical protein